MRRKIIPGESFPFDEMLDPEPDPGKKPYLGLQLIGMPRIFRQEEHGLLDALRKFRCRQRKACTDQLAPAGVVAG